MRHIIFLSLLLGATAAAESLIIDEILATVYHPEGNEIILHSDLVAGIDGQAKTFRDVALERLTLLDARKYKIQVSDEDVDRYLAQLLKQNGWTRHNFIMFLDEHGYTYEEGRELLRMKQMINQVLDYRVRSDKRMIVNRDQAFAFYEEHPIVEEATFTLVIAYAPLSQYPPDQLDALLAEDKIPEGLAWDEPFTLKESELAEDRKFIAQKNAGSIVLVEKMEDGYELTRLIEKTPEIKVPFDDVYQQVVAQIRQSRFAEVLESYQNELLKGVLDKTGNAYIKIYRPEFTL